jgi:hypothetical protein
MRVFATVVLSVFLLHAHAAEARPFAATYDEGAVVILAKVNGIEVKILETQHNRFLAYSDLLLDVQERFFGELPKEATVLSPCVAYCDENSESRIETVTGQAWIHEGDVVLLFLRSYTLGEERIFIVKDTRILVGDIGDSTRLYIPIWENWGGIDDTTCRGRSNIVINDLVGRSLRDGNQSLGGIRALFRED